MKKGNILKSLSLKNETFAVGDFSMKHDGNVKLPKVLQKYFNNREFLINK